MSRAFWEGFFEGLTLWCTWPSLIDPPKRKPSPSARRLPELKLRGPESDYLALQKDFERVMNDGKIAWKRMYTPRGVIGAHYGIEVGLTGERLPSSMLAHKKD